MPMLRFHTGTSFTTWFPMRTVPSSGCSSPAMARSTVVLPQPLGPSRLTNSAGSMLIETSWTATMLPNRLDKPVTPSATAWSSVSVMAVFSLCSISP